MPAKNKQSKKNQIKKRWFKTIAVILVILLALGVSLAYMILGQNTKKLATKNDFSALEEIAVDMKNALSSNSVSWQDASGCTDVKPRLYGDRERYYCTVEYHHSQRVNSNDDIKRIIDEQRRKIMRVGGLVSATVDQYPIIVSGIQSDDTSAMQLGSITIKLQDVLGANQACYLEYNTKVKAEDDTTALGQSIRCVVDTSGLFLNKVDEA